MPQRKVAKTKKTSSRKIKAGDLKRVAGGRKTTRKKKAT